MECIKITNMNYLHLKTHKNERAGVTFSRLNSATFVCAYFRNKLQFVWFFELIQWYF